MGDSRRTGLTPEKAERSPVTGPERASAGFGSITVLVVDDEVSVLDVSRKMLELYGFKVLTASDGYEGLEQLRRNVDTLDCVVLDMSMPRMSGEEALTAMHRISDVPIVLSSGYDEASMAYLFDGKEVAAFLQKPFLMFDLVNAVKTALSEKARVS